MLEDRDPGTMGAATSVYNRLHRLEGAQIHDVSTTTNLDVLSAASLVSQRSILPIPLHAQGTWPITPRFYNTAEQHSEC